MPNLLEIDQYVFSLKNCNDEIKNNFQDQLDSIFIAAELLDYKVQKAYNDTTNELHCYFRKGTRLHCTISVQRNKNNEFLQYSIYWGYNGSRRAFRKKNNKNFFRLLKNFKREL